MIRLGFTLARRWNGRLIWLMGLADKLIGV
jgi:hypothetical protein